MSVNGVEILEDKVKSIDEWRELQFVKDIQTFMGFANFYRRFLKTFSGICKLITDTLKADKKDFAWSLIQNEAFNVLKKRFVLTPILKHLDRVNECIIESDVSDFAIAAVLSQYHD